MKKILVLSISLLMASTAIFAQKKECNKKHEGCDKQKQECCKKQSVEDRTKAYIAEFGLAEEQAGKFADIFKSYCEDIKAIHKAHHPARPPKADVKEGEKPAEASKPSEDEIEKFTIEHFAVERELLDLSERYYKDFRGVLKPSQASKVIKDARMPHHKPCKK